MDEINRNNEIPKELTKPGVDFVNESQRVLHLLNCVYPRFIEDIPKIPDDLSGTEVDEKLNIYISHQELLLEMFYCKSYSNFIKYFLEMVFLIKEKEAQKIHSIDQLKDFIKDSQIKIPIISESHKYDDLRRIGNIRHLAVHYNCKVNKWFLDKVPGCNIEIGKRYFFHDIKDDLIFLQKAVFTFDELASKEYNLNKLIFDSNLIFNEFDWFSYYNIK